MLCEGILITIMVIGIIPSILMILPYPEKYRREKQYRENREKTEIIECESSDWKLWILRGVALIVMCMTAFAVYDFCDSIKDFFMAGILYLIGFIVHFFTYLQLDRKYYFSPHGVWVGEIAGKPVNYDELEVIKKWRTSMPFSGVYGNWMFTMRIRGKRYRVKIVTIQAEDDIELKKMDDSERLFLWLPESKQKEWSEEKKRVLRILGKLILAVSVSMVCVFGVLTCLGTGLGQKLSEPQAQVLTDEQAVYGEITTIYEGNDERLYALFDEFASVNVYTQNGEFLYAYRIPLGKKGAVQLAVKEPYVFIKNRNDIIYTFKEKQYLGKESLQNFLEKNKIEFLDDGESMEDSKIIRKDRKLLTGDAAVPYLFLGIVFLIVGATLYNKGRY